LETVLDIGGKLVLITDIMSKCVLNLYMSDVIFCPCSSLVCCSSQSTCLELFCYSRPVNNTRVVMIRKTRLKIMRTVLCCIVQFALQLLTVISTLTYLL